MNSSFNRDVSLVGIRGFYIMYYTLKCIFYTFGSGSLNTIGIEFGYLIVTVIIFHPKSKVLHFIQHYSF